MRAGFFVWGLLRKNSEKADGWLDLALKMMTEALTELSERRSSER
jgi:L-amino acid N-acyltransferase YncA